MAKYDDILIAGDGMEHFAFPFMKFYNLYMDFGVPEDPDRLKEPEEEDEMDDEIEEEIAASILSRPLPLIEMPLTLETKFETRIRQSWR